MPKMLEGSCRCGAVHFFVASHAPYPYQLCYCSICRKTQGGGGFAINLSADNKSLKVRGRRAIGMFRAKIADDEGHCHTSTGQRNFCKKCGTGLWLYDPEWPDLIHPVCIRHRHKAAGAAVKSASDAEVQGALGAARFRPR